MPSACTTAGALASDGNVGYAASGSKYLASEKMLSREVPNNWPEAAIVISLWRRELRNISYREPCADERSLPAAAAKSTVLSRLRVCARQSAARSTQVSNHWPLP